MKNITTNANDQEVIVSESGLEYVTITNIHTNSFGAILENIGNDESMVEAIINETSMEQEEAGIVVNLIIDLLNSQTIYNIYNDSEYFVRPEVAKILKKQMGISTFKGMTNDEAIACRNIEE